MKKVSKEEALEKIMEKCLEKKLSFQGIFDKETKCKNGWFGTKNTVVWVKCKICQNEWFINYNCLVHRKNNCPKCAIQRIRESKFLDDNIIFKNINEYCTTHNFKFIEICDKSGQKIHKMDCITKSYIKLKCLICGYIYITTYNKITCSDTNNSCPKCQKKLKLTKESLIENVKSACVQKDFTFISIIGDFNGNKTKIKVKCKKCGYEWTVGYSSFVNRSYSCPKCVGLNAPLTNENAIERILERVKLDNYDFLGFVDFKYNTCEWHGCKTFLHLKCKKCNHDWYPSYNNFIHQSQHCPKCHSYSLEVDIQQLLENYKIGYNFNKKYDIIDKLQLDFYLPDYNIAIECQGVQHFKPTDFAGKGEEWANEKFKGTLERDSRKRKLCEENGIKLLYYSNLHIDYPYKVYEDKNELLNEIIKDEKSK